MNITMDQTCREAHNGNLDLNASIHYIGNAFLTAVETSQEEADTPGLQIPITRMSREVIFVSSATPEEWTFILKD